MMLDLFTTGLVLNGTAPVLDDFGFLPEFYTLDVSHGTSGIISIIVPIWTKTVIFFFFLFFFLKVL